jgi:hypothetical protein
MPTTDLEQICSLLAMEKLSTYVRVLQIQGGLELTLEIGRAIPRGCITVGVGNNRYWIVHRFISCRSSMVGHPIHDYSGHFG